MRWEFADEPWPPVWPSEASTTAGPQASTTARHPGPQSAASGARSYGQSLSWTEAVSVTTTPHPPAARAA